MKVVAEPRRIAVTSKTFKTTIFRDRSVCFIRVLRKSNREAASLKGGETLKVKLELDTQKRETKPPADFVKALEAAPPAWERWGELS